MCTRRPGQLKCTSCSKMLVQVMLLMYTSSGCAARTDAWSAPGQCPDYGHGPRCPCNATQLQQPCIVHAGGFVYADECGQGLGQPWADDGHSDCAKLLRARPFCTLPRYINIEFPLSCPRDSRDTLRVHDVELVSCTIIMTVPPLLRPRCDRRIRPAGPHLRATGGTQYVGSQHRCDSQPVLVNAVGGQHARPQRAPQPAAGIR